MINTYGRVGRWRRSQSESTMVDVVPSPSHDLRQHMRHQQFTDRSCSTQVMRTLEQARESWKSLQEITHVQDFRTNVKSSDEHGSLASRSIYWKVWTLEQEAICWKHLLTQALKVFLLFESTNHSVWLRKLGDSRSAYVSLRGHLLRAIDHPDEVDTGEDPLSDNGPVRNPASNLYRFILTCQ